MEKQEGVGRHASEGGRARAERLSDERRREIARDAALARWGQSGRIATHDGELKVGKVLLGCAVLDDETRVFSQTSMQAALDRTAQSRRGPDGLPPFLAAGNLQRYITDAVVALAEPIPYRDLDGRKHLGYRVELLPEVVRIYLTAKHDGALTAHQKRTARAAEVLSLALMNVAIVALVDEATGFQEVRARDELQRILDMYVSPELQPWTRMFPDAFFEQMYRIQGWEYRPGTSKRNGYVGTLINKYIYEQLPPGVLDELRRRNPRPPKGHRKWKHHQLLTPDTGNPHLDRQIAVVTTLLRISDDKAQFERRFEKAFPPPQRRLPLVIDPPEED